MTRALELADVKVVATRHHRAEIEVEPGHRVFLGLREQLRARRDPVLPAERGLVVQRLVETYAEAARRILEQLGEVARLRDRIGRAGQIADECERGAEQA